jgi:predicted Zn-dependent peptidase
MHRIGRHELDLGRQRTLQESLGRIEAVTPTQVSEVAADVLGQPFTAALLGPFETVADLPSPLRALAR